MFFHCNTENYLIEKTFFVFEFRNFFATKIETLEKTSIKYHISCHAEKILILIFDANFTVVKYSSIIIAVINNYGVPSP